MYVYIYIYILYILHIDIFIFFIAPNIASFSFILLHVTLSFFSVFSALIILLKVLNTSAIFVSSVKPYLSLIVYFLSF